MPWVNVLMGECIDGFRVYTSLYVQGRYRTIRTRTYDILE